MTLTRARAALASRASTEIRPTSRTSTAADSALLATTARPRQPSPQRHALEAPSSRARVQTMRVCAPNAFQASTNRMRGRLFASVARLAHIQQLMAARSAKAVLQEATARVPRRGGLPLRSRPALPGGTIQLQAAAQAPNVRCVHRVGTTPELEATAAAIADRAGLEHSAHKRGALHARHAMLAASRMTRERPSASRAIQETTAHAARRHHCHALPARAWTCRSP